MLKSRFGFALVGAGLIAGAVAIGATSGQAGSEVNVYSYRQPFLVKPLFEAFESKTGVKVNVIFAKKGLIERMAQEGRNSPADVLLTVDIGRLNKAVVEDVAQPVTSDFLSDNIPAEYRDPKGHWFGLTRRARVAYVSRERVKEKSLSYEDLADPKWKGRICIRSGQHVYNLALFASVIAHDGEKAAIDWLKGLKANLAHKPSGNDRAQVKGVFGGECDIAIGNTYYMGKMQTNTKKPEQQKWADSVRIVFPGTEGRGTHVNLSGMVMAKHAPNRDNALKLMEFLSSDDAQKIYADVNFEYPVKPGIAWSDRVKSWGEFKADSISLAKVAELSALASEIVDQVQFNE